MISLSKALYTCLLADVEYYLPKAGVTLTTPGISSRNAAALLMVSSFLKKFEGEVQPDADDNALRKFTSINRDCGEWTPGWASYEDELMGEVKNQIYKFWTPCGLPLVSDFHSVMSEGRTGPGAAIGALGGDFYTKLFSSPLSATSAGLYKAYRAYIDRFPDWKAAEMQRLEQYGDVVEVLGNRLHFVPKRADISRLICIEPSLNQFCQLGFGAHLEKRLGRYFGIYLDRQPEISRELARRGSVDDNLVTIDLESASDSLSLRMLEQFLPRDFLSWLKLFRSPVTTVRGEQVTLNMVSTMGNGYTFPLQTMLFASVVFACARYRGVELHRSSTREMNYSVFGDDIICPRVIAGDVMRVLKHLGFKINAEKTFVEGPFRESCGSDWFLGQNVRPVFLKRLDTQQDRYIAINLLNSWSARTGISLPATVQLLLRKVKYQPVPPSENPEAGIMLPESMLTVKRRNVDTGALFYRADRAVATYLTIDVDQLRVRSPRSVRRKRIYNPSGLWLSFLRGDVVSGRIPVRHDRSLYRAKWVEVPSWDYIPPNCLNGQLDWQRWNSAVYFNHHG